MKIILSSLLLSAISTTCFAQSLSERLAAKSAQTHKTELVMAAGDPKKANYSVVLPLINHHIDHSILEIKPDASSGSFDSATGVCLNLDPSAIVQRDAAQYRQTFNEDGNSCDGKFTKAGTGLYPYYAYWIVLNTEAEDYVHAQVKEFNGAGKTLNVSGGDKGSGGQATLRNLARSNVLWKNTIGIQTYDADTSLRMLRDHQLDAFLIMDGRASGKIDEIAAAATKEGKPLYKFLSVNPYADFFDTKDFSGSSMYGKATLVSGGIFSRSVSTVTTDAIVIVNTDYQSANSHLVNVLANAIDAALPEIHSATKTPSDYAPNN